MKKEAHTCLFAGAVEYIMVGFLSVLGISRLQVP